MRILAGAHLLLVRLNMSDKDKHSWVRHARREPCKRHSTTTTVILNTSTPPPTGTVLGSQEYKLIKLLATWHKRLALPIIP